MLFADGVQSHLTPEVLAFMTANKISLRPRPPNCSDKIQNEDLWTFWILRNSKEHGYNIKKQEKLTWLLHNTDRTSLDFRDAMEVVKPGWQFAMNEENNRIAWRKGGLRPFTRAPELLLRRREMLNERRRAKHAAESKHRASVMSDTTQYKWDALMAAAPMKRKGGMVNADADNPKSDSDSDANDADNEVGFACGRLGAAAIFNCPDEKREALALLHGEIKDIKAMKAPELKEYIAQLNAKSPSCNLKFENNNQATLALIEVNARLFGFTVTEEMLGKKELKELWWRKNGKRPNAGGSPEKAPAATQPKNRFWRLEQAVAGVMARAPAAARAAAATTNATSNATAVDMEA